MAQRQRLPNRRPSESFAFELGGLHFIATIGRFDDGRLAEIFIGNGKAGSDSDSAAKDSAVVASIALQYGVPLDVIRNALLRDPRGIASSPLGQALDIIAGAVMSSLLEAALDYAATGLAAFPLVAKSKEPATRRGFYDATTNPAALRRWFGGAQEYNIGIRTGMASGGVWVLDVDDDESFRELEHQHGILPPTRTSQSSRGLHLWFRSRVPIQCSAGRITPGLDARGEGGYIVAPPSIHPDGPIYRWLNNKPIGPAPTWLEELTRRRPPLASTISQRAVAGIRRPYSGAPGAYAAAALKAEIAELANTAPGGRNHALNRASFSLHQLVAGGELDSAEVERRLLEAATANGLMADPHDGPARVKRTIESGARAGLQCPRSRPGR